MAKKKQKPVQRHPTPARTALEAAVRDAVDGATLTRRQLAARMGLGTARSLHIWFSGTRQPTPAAAARVADALGQHLAELARLVAALNVAVREAEAERSAAVGAKARARTRRRPR